MVSGTPCVSVFFICFYVVAKFNDAGVHIIKQGARKASWMLKSRKELVEYVPLIWILRSEVSKSS